MTDLITDFRQVFFFMKKTGVRLRFFLWSLGLSLGLAIFNLYTVSLLFPLVQGIVKRDWSGAGALPGIGRMIRLFPSTFSSPVAIFLLLVVWIYATIIVKNILQYSAAMSAQHQANIAREKVRGMLLDKVLAFGKAFYDEHKLSWVQDVLTSSTGAIENQFRLLQNFLIQLLLLAAYFFVMFRISWQLTLISALCFPVINFFTKRLIIQVKKAVANAKVATQTLNERVFQILYSLPIIIGFGKEDVERALFAEASVRDIARTSRIQKFSNLLPPIEDIGATTGMLVLAIGLAFLMYSNQRLDPSSAIILFYLAMKIVPALNSMNDFRLGLAVGSAAVADVNQILHESDRFILPDGRRELQRFEHSIEIRNLTFSYANDHVALRDFSLIINRGAVVVIAGATGAGKSTLVNLLLRFYDCPPGTIFIDDIDIREYSRRSLRRRIAFASQEVLLFSTSLRHNIAYGSSEAVDEKTLRETANKTAVSDFALKLAAEYDTPITERGTTFSGGERQRIALARALLKDHDILILDEATNALDSATEQRVLDAILREAKNASNLKTVIIISHRPLTVPHADQIVSIGATL